MEQSQNQSSFQNTISKLQSLFEYYCQYGERLNTTIMKSHKFIKISKEANIMSTIINRTRLEIIYKSENKYNTMNFNQFLNCLMKIADIKYQNEDMTLKQKVQTLIEQFFLPLHETIFATEIKLDSESIDGFLYSPICEEILTSICPILFDIYRVYFPHEVSIAENASYVKENSQKSLFQFCRNFDIAPGLISKPIVYQIFQSETLREDVDESIAKNKNYYFQISKKIDIASLAKYDHNNHNILGQFFIFFKFVRALVKMAMITFNKEDFKDISSQEKLILFFQKIEVSEGFLSFELKTNKTHNEKTACIIKQELLDKIADYFEGKDTNEQPTNTINEESVNTNNEGKKENESTNNINTNIVNTNTTANYLMSDNYQTEFSNYLNEVYGSDLLLIFKGIVNCGDQFNYKYMKSKAFMKFLVEANLVKISGKTNFGLKMNEVDTLFVKLSILNKSLNSQEETEIPEEPETDIEAIANACRATKKNFQSKIEFETFLIGIEIIAKVVYDSMPPKEAIDKVVNEHIFSNLSNAYGAKIKSIEDKIEILKDLQSSDEYIKILEVTHKAVTPIFKFYTKATNNLMSFKSFLQFAQDFEIFPCIISKAKLNAFFGGIAQYSNYNDNESEVYIEQSLFVDMLALCANEIVLPEPEPNPVEKILIFMEKIGQSEGPEKIIINTGNNRMMAEDTLNILEEFKEEYPQYFEVKEDKKENFMDLMSE